MEPTLFSFIWKYSRREQMMLLFVTLITFPFLYVTLELPKRIINDAIGADNDQVFMLGVDLSQTQFLMTLCVGSPNITVPTHDSRWILTRFDRPRIYVGLAPKNDCPNTRFENDLTTI